MSDLNAVILSTHGQYVPPVYVELVHSAYQGVMDQGRPSINKDGICAYSAPYNEATECRVACGFGHMLDPGVAHWVDQETTNSRASSDVRSVYNFIQEKLGNGEYVPPKANPSWWTRGTLLFFAEWQLCHDDAKTNVFGVNMGSEADIRSIPFGSIKFRLVFDRNVGNFCRHWGIERPVWAPSEQALA